MGLGRMSRGRATTLTPMAEEPDREPTPQPPEPEEPPFETPTFDEIERSRDDEVEQRDR